MYAITLVKKSVAVRQIQGAVYSAIYFRVRLRIVQLTTVLDISVLLLDLEAILNPQRYNNALLKTKE